MKPLIVIAGPTASGKSHVGVALAKKINGEIISVDSMQVYKGMDIGTAKIMQVEQAGISHHLLDVFSPDEACSIAKFQEMVKEALEKIYKKGKIPILVGGTGFYIRAIVYDTQFETMPYDSAYREKLEQTGRTEAGKEVLYDQLKEVDIDAWKAIHKNNIKRVIRAIEYHYLTGKKISHHNQTEKERISPYQLGYYVLTREREELYRRINRRVDQMFEEGLVEEVKGLMAKGYDQSMVSMQALGYKEIIDYLEGTSTLEEAKEILKRDTRHFAKRQLTWFRKEKEVIWVDLSKEKQGLEFILKDIEERKLLYYNEV